MRQMTFFRLVEILLLCGIGFNAQAQEAKTLSYDSLSPQPIGYLDKITWIAGSWSGEAFGAKTEEVWTIPTGSSMMGMFKLYDEGEVIFYELMIIRQIGKTLLMQLKHFNNDLKGWESQEETVDFKLVKQEEKMVYFDGLTFEYISPTEMNVYVVIEEEGDGINEEKFYYKKEQ
jgi:hypothetical protein